MKRIHISLVGGQPAPVYYGAYQADPDVVFLICSSQTKSEADRLQGMLKKDFEVSVAVFNPSDLEAIHVGIERIKKRLADDDYLSLNIVGGTKFWSLMFFDAFASRPNTAFLLVDQNNRMWDLRSRKSEPLYTDIDIDEHLELYGNPITSYRAFSSYTEEDADTAETMNRLWNSMSFRQSFKSLVSVMNEERKEKFQNQRTGSFIGSNGAKVSWEKPDRVLFYLFDRNKEQEIELCSPNAVSLAFNSGWFEYQVARILSKWPMAKEIRLNCKFPFRRGNESNLIKNEVDIIVNAGSKLLFVECKTSIFNGTDIDKFATVVKNYGGSGSKAVFICLFSIPDIPMQKCIESGIIPFSFQGNTAEQLYKLLEQEINQINA